jgi:SSS family solute:Na+ symporter
MIDIVVVCGYFALMLVVGWRARGSSADAYWVADRRYGTLPVSASLVATVFGASSTVGIIGLGYSRGLTGAWWSLMGGVALVPFGFILAGRVRRLGVYTLPDILHRAYGARVSVAGAGIIALAWCGVVAAQIVAGALLLGTVMPVGFHASLTVVTLIFVLYTLWGGQLSVVRTDSWQIFLFVGALLAALVLVARAGLAGPGLMERLPYGHLRFPTSPEFGWYQLLVYYPLIVGMPYLVGPDIYSRVLCARTEASARNASLAAAMLVLPIAFLLAGLGLLISGIMPGLPPEAALPSALTELAPVGLKGLIVVGVLGAIMSSADTTLISASTIVSLNMATPLLGLGESARLRWTRVGVVAVGVAAWVLAVFQEGVIDSLLLAYTVFVGGVALPTLASFWKDRLGVTRTGALGAVVLGGVTALAGELGGDDLFRNLLGEPVSLGLRRVLGPEYGSILPLIVSAASLLVMSRLFPEGREPEGG